MVERTLDEAARAMSGSLIGGQETSRFVGAAIDSRRTAAGNLFFALEGERTDGHRFIADAWARGAAAVVVHRDPNAEDGAWLRVEDTFRALHDLTRHVRESVPRQLVAITGSVGKTTTKELLAAMLATTWRTAKSPGNLNNLYGFPLSLLGVDDDCEWMVAEMGMSTPGELRAISLLGRPDVAVLTNVRPAHLASFPDLDGIAEAKGELLAGVPANGVVVANADDERVMRIAARHAGRLVRFGHLRNTDRSDHRRDNVDFALADVRPRPDGAIGSVFSLIANPAGKGETVEVTLPLHGLYNAENCLAAAACAHALGVSLQDIARAVSQAKPGAMRGVVETLADGVVLVDDTYNANPDAVERALESAALLAAERRIAVLGDMLELGATSAALHTRVGKVAAHLGFDLVVGVGAESKTLVEAAGLGGCRTLWLPDATAAVTWTREADGPKRGDLVLVKGSRGIALEAVTQSLRQRAENEVGDA
jgi:UDP-N-acetylmuramoyl-tripeptide--D-alanyl-D-alanine ligase